MFLQMLAKFQVEIVNSGQYLHMVTEYDMGNNLERMRYGEHLLKKHQRIFKLECALHNNKSDETAISLRAEGNYLHNRGEYAEAVICYNKSLCFAASSVNIAIGYSNRSASLFQMGRFKECKENIRLARELNALPENIKRRLDNRMLQCGNEDQGVTSNELNLTYRNHPSLPFIVDRLEIKQEGGKFWIYAKEYIEPCTVIIKEKVFNCLLFPNGYFTNCHFCLKTSGDLIPCPDCTSAMFCNKDCMMRANEQFHKWECPIIDLLNSFDDRMKFSLRVLLHMLHFFGDYDKLEKYWRELPQNSVSWFSIKRPKLTQTEQFQIFHSSEKLELEDSATMALESVGVAFFKTEILKHSNLKWIFQTKKQIDLFGEIISHHSLIFREHSKLIMKYGEDSFNLDTSYAVGYELIKEIKSTDSPNVYQKWDGNHIIWYVCQPIKKGECLQTNNKQLPYDGFNPWSVIGMKCIMDEYIKMFCESGCNDP